LAKKLSAQELRAQLAAVVKDDHPEVVALSTPADFDGESLDYQGRTFLVRKARSVLEFHDLIAQAQGNPLLCLTQLEDHELGLDLRCRLHKRRVRRVDAWTAVKHLFQCQRVESSLVTQPHLAAYLLESQPPERYPKAKGEILTAEHGWSCLFHHRLNMPGEYLDALSLLTWAAGDCTAYLDAPDDLKQSARTRVTETCGELGRAILATVDDNQLNATALGLALRCVASESPDIVQEKALTRVEQYVGNKPLSAKLAREWADAAEHLVETASESTAGLLDQAAKILTLLKAENKAFLSDVLPEGLSQRLETLAGDLKKAVDTGLLSTELESDCQSSRSHRALNPEQNKALLMLPRLLRWLHSPASSGKRSFPELTHHFAHDTAYAEWARLRCEGGLPSELRPSVKLLLDKVSERLEGEAQTFSKGLAAWNEAGEPGDGLWKVEQLVDSLLLPIVSQKGGRFLLVVLDGCGWPTLHELMESFPDKNWLRLSPEGSSKAPPLLATYPSVTEFSRTSLLCGSLMQGNSSVEKTRFREHAALKAACAQGYPPLLFHKADLDDGHGHLSSEVENKIGNPKHKAIGVVLNAVDDHLDRDDQICHPWNLSTIRYLSDLVTRAYQSDRLLILVSDHGHVLERGAELRKPKEGGGARWRPGEKAKTGEIVLTGPRVLSGGNSVVMPWSERLRYTNKKNGYHGGCHPAELVCSLLVLSKSQVSALKGWDEAYQPKPSWWYQDKPEKRRQRAGQSKKPSPPKRAKIPTGQMLLIEDPVPPPQSFSDLVFNFPLVVESWKQAKDGPDQQWAKDLLDRLEKNGDKAGVGELASHFGIAEDRFRELLQAVSTRLLIDGQYLVSVTPDAGTVLLNRSSFSGVAPSGPRQGSLIEVERANGAYLSFWVPLKILTSNERRILENLAIYEKLTESELKKSLGTKRVGGIVEKLMEKLHKEGFDKLGQVGEGSGGRIYRLETGGLGS
jgi:hypothetical protein